MHDDAPLTKLLRPALASLRAYSPHPCPPGAIRLDANESPFSPPAEVLQAALSRAAREVAFNRYPDPRCGALRDAIARRAGCDPDALVVGNGTDEVIALILCALSRPRPGVERATALSPSPSFVMYQHTALTLGVEPVTVPLDDAWDLDVSAMRGEVLRARPNVVFLPSPNNPTGNRFDDDRVDAVIAMCPDALVLLDEAYRAFASRGYDALRRAHPNVGQLQTLSKVGFAALRCGWAILPTELAQEVDKVRQPYNLDTLTQRVALEVIETLGPWVDERAAALQRERERVARELDAMEGAAVTPSEANFVWVRVDDAARVHAALLARGVRVRSFHAQGGRLARQLRVTIGTPRENDALLDAMRAALRGCPNGYPEDFAKRRESCKER